MIMTGGSAARQSALRSGQGSTLSLAMLVGAGIAGVSAFLFDTAAEAKTPGSTYCYYGTCHRVKTIAETEGMVGTKEVVQASFYDDCKKDSLNPCGLTSSGETFSPNRPDNAASPIYPDGTTLLVWAPQSKEAAVLRVNNAGPYWGGRKLDVSRAAAEALGFAPYGVAQLQVKVLEAPSPAEATYKRYRRYHAVPGPFGRYDSIEEARLSIAVMEAFDDMPTASVEPPIADVALAITNGADADILHIDVPEPVVVVAAAEVQPTRAKMKTTVKRQEAKAKRMAAKRKQHYARRNGAKRSSVASRRQARGARYAQQERASSSRRYARSNKAGRSRYVVRQLRGRRPALTRSIKRGARRMAEVRLPGANAWQPLNGSRLLRGVPSGALMNERTPLPRPPVSGPVQVV